MPHIIEFTTSAFHGGPQTKIKLDLDFLQAGVINRIANLARQPLVTIAGVKIPEDKTGREYEAAISRINRYARNVLHGACLAFPLSVVATKDMNVAASIFRRGTFPNMVSFTDPEACIKTLGSLFSENINSQFSPEIIKQVNLTNGVMQILHSISFGNDDTILPFDAKICSINDSENEFLFLPATYPGFDGDNDDLSTFIKQSTAKKASKHLNPTGKDALRGPVFAYGSIVQMFTIDLEDIKSMVDTDFLNDREAVEEEKTNGLDWSSMWDDRACGRGEGILDTVDTHILKDRLRPLLDTIIVNVTNACLGSNDCEKMSDAVTEQFDAYHSEISAIIDQWNKEQIAFDYLRDNKSIVTFAPTKMNRTQIVDALISSAQNGLEDIATIRKEIGADTSPWETLASQWIEQSHIAMMTPKPEPEAINAATPSDEPEPANNAAPGLK